MTAQTVNDSQSTTRWWIYVWAEHPVYGHVLPRLAVGPNEEYWVIKSVRTGKRYIVPESEVETRRTTWDPWEVYGRED